MCCRPIIWLTCAFLLLGSLGCGGNKPAPAAAPASQGTATNDTPAPAAAEPAPVADPTELTTHTIVSGEVVSVHNVLGDRVNIETMSPWPPILGTNIWSISFKPAEGHPLALSDHMGLELSREGQAADESIQYSYSGGSSGGALTWNPAIAGVYTIHVVVKRGGELTGPIDFSITVGDPATTPAT